MQTRDGGKTVFDAPVDFSLRKLLFQIADHRQVVDDIAERGSFHDQYAHRRIKCWLSKPRL